MFRGSSFNTVDPKGRIIVPTRLRAVVTASFGNGLVLTRMDGGLFAYTIEEWAQIEKSVFSVKTTSAAMRRFRRVFIGGSQKCKIDKQGRILVPPVFRDYAGLETEVALVGQGRHFEIWSTDRYLSEIEQYDEDLKDENFGNEIADLGL